MASPGRPRSPATGEVPDKHNERTRSRSRSPDRRKPRSDRGFRWKERRLRQEGERNGDGRRLNRGYRQDHDDHYRPERRDARKEPEPGGQRSREKDDDVAAKFGTGTAVKSDATGAEQAPKPKKQSTPKAPSQPMIRVTVNDRLGTKSVIPCLPSDNVGDFKKLVAARIGRKPHEIMLKRQSERPFKDMLTLEDYGVSDGVQLDLELDTGD